MASASAEELACHRRAEEARRMLEREAQAVRREQDALEETRRMLEREAQAARDDQHWIRSPRRYDRRCRELELLQREADRRRRRLLVCLMLHERTGGLGDLVRAVFDLGTEHAPPAPAARSPRRPDAQDRWDHRFRAAQ